MLQCCVCRLSFVTLCLVAKRCVLEQKLLLTAYKKSYMGQKFAAYFLGHPVYVYAMKSLIILTGTLWWPGLKVVKRQRSGLQVREVTWPLNCRWITSISRSDRVYVTRHANTNAVNLTNLANVHLLMTIATSSSIVLYDTWNRSDDNDTVWGIAILDTTAIPEMRYAVSMFFCIHRLSHTLVITEMCVRSSVCTLTRL